MITYGWGRSQASDKLINMNSDSLRIPTGYAILVREMSAADEASSSASFTGRKPDLAAAMGEFGAASATRSVEPPRTPIGALARKAGALLGAAETVRVYKQTDCAYALPRSFPSADQLWRDEIFPAIPAGHKDEFSKLLESLRPLLKRQADTMVAESFRSVSGKLDRKTVCGLVGGVLATVFGRATDEFQEQKMAFAAGKVRP